MSSLPKDFYSRWRSNSLAIPLLHDGGEDPPENLLQQIWQHQRLLRSELKTADGKSIQILHPGFWNHEAGPDFRSAIVQFEKQSPIAGDIEIDLHPADWLRHRHQGNPAYAKVVLHVVWNTAGPSGSALPVLPIGEKLDAPIAELAEWLGTEKSTPTALDGKCRGPLRELSASVLEDLLRQAAMIRFQRKASDLHALARQCGWEGALWQGLFAALGYKQNVWPMRAIAERLDRISAGGNSTNDVLELLQARLLGVSGLLPAEIPRTGCANAAGGYVRRVWDHWWREREEFADAVLPRAAWRFNNLRPANHPQRRLALASHWLNQKDLFGRLECWFTTEISNENLLSSMQKVFTTNEDDFWSRHYTFESKRIPKPMPLLGAARVTDLAMNVILPWFWVRSVAGRNRKLRDEAERRYFAWPQSEDNAVLRLARTRLLGGSTARLPKTGAAQQGLLQIVRDFCEQSNALCDNCRFPDLVRAIPVLPLTASQNRPVSRA